MKRLAVLSVIAVLMVAIPQSATAVVPTAPTGMHYVGTVKTGTCTAAMSSHHLCSLNAFAPNTSAIKTHPNCVNCVFPVNPTTGIELCSSQGCWEFHDELDMNWWYTSYSPYGPLSWWQWDSLPNDVGWYNCHSNIGGIGYSVSADCGWRGPALVSNIGTNPNNYVESYGTMQVCFVASWFPLCASFWMELQGGRSGAVVRSYG